MILDALLLFTGSLNGATSGGGATFASSTTDEPTTGTQVSSNVLDLGLIGIPSFANGGGARDIGIGDDPAMKVLVVVTEAFTGGTSLQLTLSGAPDNGSGAPGSYTVMWTGPAVVEANLGVGAYLANIDMPRPVPGQAMPRFLRLGYVTVGTHTAGEILGTLVLDRMDQPTGTSGNMSGYPAGLNVAN